MSQGKLVRDKIPEIIRATGEVPHTRVADGAEYRSLLLAKLSEEVQEFITSDCDPVELADVFGGRHGASRRPGNRSAGAGGLRAEKAAERGGFSQGIVWSGNRPAVPVAPAMSIRVAAGQGWLGRLDEQYLTRCLDWWQQVLPGGGL